MSLTLRSSNFSLSPSQFEFTLFIILKILRHPMINDHRPASPLYNWSKSPSRDQFCPFLNFANFAHFSILPSRDQFCPFLNVTTTSSFSLKSFCQFSPHRSSTEHFWSSRISSIRLSIWMSCLQICSLPIRKLLFNFMLFLQF